LLFYLIELQCSIIHSHRLSLCSVSVVFVVVVLFDRKSMTMYDTTL
jgi:hypothetical protein